MNPVTIVGEVYPQLHATNSGDIAGWTESDLYSYLNRSVGNLCADVAMLGAYQTVNVAALTSTIAFPANTASLIQVAWNNKVLRPRSVAEMDARHGNWQNASGADEPECFILDQQGDSFLKLWPVPAIGGALNFWVRQRPPALTQYSGLAVVAIADWIAEMEIVAEGNRKGGLFAMAEAAESAQSIADIIKAAARTYYGGTV